MSNHNNTKTIQAQHLEPGQLLWDDGEQRFDLVQDVILDEDHETGMAMIGVALKIKGMRGPAIFEFDLEQELEIMDF